MNEYCFYIPDSMGYELDHSGEYLAESFEQALDVFVKDLLEWAIDPPSSGFIDVALANYPEDIIYRVRLGVASFERV